MPLHIVRELISTLHIEGFAPIYFTIDGDAFSVPE